MKKELLFTLLATLGAAWGIFHFKDWLGAMVMPLFLILVVFVTLKLYRLMVSDDADE
ncbi:hypothetical protein L9G15_09865 [Shewanella sp. A3A]|uniref:Uncharacterized protein n=1 Tax=Shewanella electrica TaxID=515560 RepID=A0ABT2FKX3_9GAMM|nr:hypothetical protein [Shewanella electrica]MCH1919739.1 hypothetical protein [Shewanella ferrihydritica]MCH1923771.1 hypothetical protein [Shewanella electrica]MCS4556989.1 hypothetical protein [Shewanella electrica]